MALPRSDDKRSAILEAAAEVVADLGPAAPTAKISKRAGVAEGTLFTYFASKDELLNRLYVGLKDDLRLAMMAGYPSGGALVDRGRHAWDRYIAWGTARPAKLKALRQLAVSGRITEASREASAAGFAEFFGMMRECADAGALSVRSTAFVSAIMSAVAETTMEFIVREPEEAGRYRDAGFEAFWRAIAG